MDYLTLNQFYDGKRVLVTGHTGFKGTWLCQILKFFGAELSGYALAPEKQSLFELTKMDNGMHSHIGDIRDLSHLKKVFDRERPEIVIHMAAQPLVRESYRNPVLTYETNVMGTVNVMECIRLTPSVESVVNVTTDKVYRNNEWEKGYVETDFLDGYDPYSNSKSCSELVTHSYVQSFLEPLGIAVSTCRAGNVIGGGDFAKDRIIPDCVRAAFAKEQIVVRNPFSTRPYQHVLEPLFAYLIVAMKQYKESSLAGSYNVGPDDENCVTTGELVTMFCEAWNSPTAAHRKTAGTAVGSQMAKKKLYENPIFQQLSWRSQSDGGPHEANFLKLDCTKLKQTFDWKPKWSIKTTLEQVVEFEQLRFLALHKSVDMDTVLLTCMYRQIETYMEIPVKAKVTEYLNNGIFCNKMMEENEDV